MWRVLIHTEKHRELQRTLNEQEESEKKIEEHRERERDWEKRYLLDWKKMGKCIYQNLITFEIYHHIYIGTITAVTEQIPSKIYA